MTPAVRNGDGEYKYKALDSQLVTVTAGPWVQRVEFL